MKATVNKATTRKLVAVLGVASTGYYVPCFFEGKSGSRYMDFDGVSPPPKGESLEQLLKEEPKRQPVYEGDSVTIQF